MIEHTSYKATRYLIRTARGYFKSSNGNPAGAKTDWTPLQSEAHRWVDIDECHLACRRYSDVTGESAVVVVIAITPAASSGIAVGTEP